MLESHECEALINEVRRWNLRQTLKFHMDEDGNISGWYFKDGNTVYDPLIDSYLEYYRIMCDTLNGINEQQNNV